MQLILNTLALSKIQNWLWLIGLTLGTLGAIFLAIYVLKKFRSWLKSDVPSSAGNNKAFNLNEIKNMRDKGLISNDEYSQLRDAYIKCK